MQRRQFIQTLAGTLACASTVAARPLAARGKPLSLGVFPRRNVKTTYLAFKPLTDYLEQSLGVSVHLRVSNQFSDFWRDVKFRRYDIVHFNQYHYLVSRRYYGYQVILKNQEFGQDSFAGALFARKDSGLNSLQELKDKTILFGGGKRAMLSYIVPTWMLRNAGLDKGDYVEKIALNPPNAVISLYHNQADAAGAGETISQMGLVKKNIDISQLMILSRSDQLTHLPWAVRNDMPVQLRDDIQAALAGLHSQPAGPQILKGAQLTALTVATDEEYALSEKIIRELYGDGLGESS